MLLLGEERCKIDMSKIKDYDRNLIMVIAQKGGSGKSLVSFIIVLYLVYLKKKVRIIELDFFNKGLASLVNTNMSKEDINKYLIIEDHCGSIFFKDVNRKFLKRGREWDYSIIDTFVGPEFYINYRMLLPHTSLIIFLVPNDVSIDQNNLIHSINTHGEIMPLKFKIIMNSKNKEKLRLTKLYKALKENINADLQNSLLDKHIPHMKIMEEVFENYKTLGEFLLKISI